MYKTSYSMGYSDKSKEWIVWKKVEGNNSIGIYSEFKGTKNECSKRLKQLKKKD